MFLAPEAEEPTAAAQENNGGGSGLALTAVWLLRGTRKHAESMDTGLLSFVFASNCGDSDTITKLKLASLHSAVDVKLCNKSVLQELGINIGDANRHLCCF
jgi:hypothetical protein